MSDGEEGLHGPTLLAAGLLVQGHSTQGAGAIWCPCSQMSSVPKPGEGPCVPQRAEHQSNPLGA